MKKNILKILFAVFLILGLHNSVFASSIITADGTNLNFSYPSNTQIVFFDNSGNFVYQFHFIAPSISYPYSFLGSTLGSTYSYLHFDGSGPVYEPSCNTLSNCESNFANSDVATITLTAPTPPSSPIPSSIFYARSGGASTASDLVASVGTATQATGASFGPMVAVLGGVLLAFIFVTWLISTIKETDGKTKSKKNKRI